MRWTKQELDIQPVWFIDLIVEALNEKNRQANSRNIKGRPRKSFHRAINASTI